MNKMQMLELDDYCNRLDQRGNELLSRSRMPKAELLHGSINIKEEDNPQINAYYKLEQILSKEVRGYKNLGDLKEELKNMGDKPHYPVGGVIGTIALSILGVPSAAGIGLMAGLSSPEKYQEPVGIGAAVLLAAGAVYTTCAGIHNTIKLYKENANKYDSLTKEIARIESEADAVRKKHQ